MRFLICAGFPRTELNILSGKDALIITSVGGRELNYATEGKYKKVEELFQD
jgi:hypothetical protein